MVQAMIEIPKEVNQILNIVKAKYGLRTKSEAISKIVSEYGFGILEPELRPEYIKKAGNIIKQKAIKVGTIANLRKRYE